MQALIACALPQIDWDACVRKLQLVLSKARRPVCTRHVQFDGAASSGDRVRDQHPTFHYRATSCRTSSMKSIC